MNFKLAIDGPAASGKSTISKLIAKRLNFVHIDTGAIYRAVAFYALSNNLDTDSESSFDYLDKIKITYKNDSIYLNDLDITKKIRTPEISNLASKISAYKTVRDKLYHLQKRLASENSLVVMDGRDIGTVILPDADLKIFLTATLTERAKRRKNEKGYKGIKDINKVISEISKRDENDKSRKQSPLKMADDAVLIDTTNMSIEMVVDKIIKLIKQKEK